MAARHVQVLHRNHRSWVHVGARGACGRVVAAPAFVAAAAVYAALQLCRQPSQPRHDRPQV